MKGWGSDLGEVERWEGRGKVHKTVGEKVGQCIEGKWRVIRNCNQFYCSSLLIFLSPSDGCTLQHWGD